MNMYNSLLYDLKGLIFALQIGGLLPLFEMKSYKMIVLSKKRLLLSYGIQFLMYVIVVYSVYELLSNGSKQLFYSYREIDNGNNLLEILLGIITYMLMLYLGMRNCNLFADTVNDIMKTNEILEQHYGDRGMTLRINEMFFPYISTIIVWALQLYIGILKIMAVQDILFMRTCIQISIHGLQNILIFMFVFLMTALLRILAFLFKALNDIISKYTYKSPERVDFKEKFSKDCLFVFRIHNDLLRNLHCVEKFCSPIMLIYMGYTFFATTSNMLSIVIQIKTQRSLSYILFQLSIVVVFVHILALVLLTRCVQKCITKANTTAQLFAKIYVVEDIENITYQNYIDTFLMRALNQRTEFTVYGLFNTDISILFKIFSAVTTFLVVMIQFRQMGQL